MNLVLSNLLGIEILAYLDDIIVFSKDLAIHFTRF